MVSQDALAVNGEFGILEGRSVALVHPIVMGSLFVYTLWAGYLGWQWRRVRTIQSDINELKKQVKPTPVTPDGKPAETAPSPVEIKIQQLTEVGFSRRVHTTTLTSKMHFRHLARCIFKIHAVTSLTEHRIHLMVINFI